MKKYIPRSLKYPFPTLEEKEEMLNRLDIAYELGRYDLHKFILIKKLYLDNFKRRLIFYGKTNLFSQRHCNR